MSFDLKLRRTCDHRIYNEEHIVDADNKTVVTTYPITNRNVTVKVNGYPFPQNNQIEKQIVEDLTGYFNGTNNSFVVSGAPIYDGLNLLQLATQKNSIQVQIKVTDENDSSQFTGTENWFITQHLPLLTEFNFSQNIIPTDVTVKVNGSPVTVTDVDSVTGRIALKTIPLVSDVVTVTYFFKATIDSFNATTGAIKIKEYPTPSQQIKVRYYSRQNNGWQIVHDTQNKIKFDQQRITNRVYVANENVSSQINGITKIFKTQFYPIMPLSVTINTEPLQTLPNSVVVTINGTRNFPDYVDPLHGFVYLRTAPAITDVVLISYFYKNSVTPDIITTEYQTGINTCPKCNAKGYVDDIEYDPSGDLIIVENEEKLIQDVAKIVSTIKGSNTEHAWYGTSLESLIGYSLLPSFVKSQISVEIQNAVRDLKDLQVKQTEYQDVTAREFINSIRNLAITQNTSDPSYWQVQADIITQARTNAEFTESIQFESL